MKHNCDLCGSDQATPLEVARPYVGKEAVPVVCEGCGFVYVRERRSHDEIVASWKQMYREKAYDPSWPGVRARLFYVAEWIDHNFAGKGARHIDLGGGDGWFSGQMHWRDWNTSSTDPAFEQDGLTIGASANANLVTINWTLENCVDCIGLLSRARSMLRGDGYIVVATGSRIRVPPRKFLSAYFSRNPADTHCFRWTPASLTRALTLAGFAQPKFNDYQQNDVLLACAKVSETAVNAPLVNEHDEVMAHFDQWAANWP